MAVQVRASSVITTTSSGAFSVDLAKPTGTVDGDKLLVLIQSSASSVALTPPAGWDAVDDSGGANQGAYLFAKTAASEGSTFSFTGNTGGNSSHVGICVALYNTDGGTPSHTLYTETVDGSADTTADNTGVTPTMAPGALLLALIGSKSVQTSYSTYAVADNNPTWVELQDANANISGEASSAAAAYATGRDLITATGAFSATIANSSTSTVYLFSIQPASLTVSAPVLTASGALIAPAVSAAATISAPVLSASGAVPAPTVTETDPEFVNATKNNSSFTNAPKS